MSTQLIRISTRQDGLLVSGQGLQKVPFGHLQGYFLDKNKQSAVCIDTPLEPYLPQCEIIPVEGESVGGEDYFFQYKERGMELLHLSKPVSKANTRIPLGELRARALEFHNATEGVNPFSRSVREKFTLPDIEKYPEFYRVYKNRLFILWGLESESTRDISEEKRSFDEQVAHLARGLRKRWLLQMLKPLGLLLLLLLLLFGLWWIFPASYNLEIKEHLKESGGGKMHEWSSESGGQWLVPVHAQLVQKPQWWTRTRKLSEYPHAHCDWTVTDAAGNGFTQSSNLPESELAKKLLKENSTTFQGETFCILALPPDDSAEKTFDVKAAAHKGMPDKPEAFIADSNEIKITVGPRPAKQAPAEQKLTVDIAKRKPEFYDEQNRMALSLAAQLFDDKKIVEGNVAYEWTFGYEYISRPESGLANPPSVNRSGKDVDFLLPPGLKGTATVTARHPVTKRTATASRVFENTRTEAPKSEYAMTIKVVRPGKANANNKNLADVLLAAQVTGTKPIPAGATYVWEEWPAVASSPREAGLKPNEKSYTLQLKQKYKISARLEHNGKTLASASTIIEAEKIGSLPVPIDIPFPYPLPELGESTIQLRIEPTKPYEKNQDNSLAASLRAQLHIRQEDKTFAPAKDITYHWALLEPRTAPVESAKDQPPPAGEKTFTVRAKWSQVIVHAKNPSGELIAQSAYDIENPDGSEDPQPPPDPIKPDPTPTPVDPNNNGGQQGNGNGDGTNNGNGGSNGSGGTNDGDALRLSDVPLLEKETEAVQKAGNIGEITVAQKLNRPNYENDYILYRVRTDGTRTGDDEGWSRRVPFFGPTVTMTFYVFKNDEAGRAAVKAKDFGKAILTKVRVLRLNGRVIIEDDRKSVTTQDASK